ncbi:MAG: phosphopyruvate hydratase, partial [Thermoplasmata archaeon]|nr:phosphopyruvate hydratase [Thermoplasmata archaeon]
MTLIEEVNIRKVLDSRGNPTVEVEVATAEGFGAAMAPSGASTGVHEVKALPKGGVDAGMRFFNEKVGDELLGMDVLDQRLLDGLLKSIDGSNDFSKMGGNVAVACSIAFAKSAASALAIPLYRYIGGLTGQAQLPRPLGNVIGGGRHAIGGTDIQEFLVMAQSGPPSKTVFGNALVHRRVKEKLAKKLPDAAIGKGDEGAWVAAITNEEALDIVASASKEISQETGLDIRPALDMAASEFFKGGNYVYKDKTISPGEQIDYVLELIHKYHLCLVEDPLEQEDFGGYAELTSKVNAECMIVGDDLFVTNTHRIKEGIGIGACNSVLIKPNQIGTLTDTLDAVEITHRAGYRTVVSHRSGETPDQAIAHIAAGVGAYAIKTGVVGG